MENKTFTRARENDHTADGDKMVSSRAVIDVIESFDVLDGYQDKVELVSRIEALPAQQQYEPVTAEDFAKTMSENTIWRFAVWHGEALALMKEQGFVICKRTM